MEAALLEGLPPRARRWAERAVAPGARLPRAARIGMRGQIRLGAWSPFSSVLVIVPGRALVWAATARVRGLPVSGLDAYLGGAGLQDWRLLGLVPVVRARGPDVTRSARGRLAAEAALVPSALLGPGVRWEDAEGGARAHVDVDGHPHALDLGIEEDGALRSVSLLRWGDPDGAGFRALPFGVVFEGPELRAEGLALPGGGRAGWGFGAEGFEEGVFFRFRLAGAELA